MRFFAWLCVAVVLSDGLSPALAERPILYVVENAGCPPCKNFDWVYSTDGEMRAALHEVFEVRELDLQIPADQAYAQRLGVRGVPAFIVVRGGRVFAKSCGFTAQRDTASVRAAQQKLFDDLGVLWPRQKADVAPVDSFRRSERAPAAAVPALPPVTAPAADDAAEISTRREDAARAETQIFAPPAVVVPPDISPEIIPTIPVPAQPAARPAPSSVPSPTAGKWLAVLGWLAKTGVAIAAPEIALPGSVGLTLAGFALTWLRRRRAARQPGVLGTAGNPIALRDHGTVRTDTKFVVTETDVLGEAYAEAVRRIGNLNREKHPQVVDILQQVHGVAQQLAHGQRIVRRPSTLSASETLP